MILALIAGLAHAASLDLLDVGGSWGTPASEDATSVYWNPAGIAGKGGTQFLIEGAPTLASMTFDRDDPYFGGVDKYRYFGIAPFLGITSDFGTRDFGFGLAVAVPQARGASSEVPNGPGGFSLMKGGVQVIHAILGVSWSDPKRIVSVGVSGAFVRSQYDATLGVDAMSAVVDAAADLGINLETTDAMVEDPNYSTVATFGPMVGTGAVISGGVIVRPSPVVSIAASFKSGLRVEHLGPVALDFGCPPDDDALTRFAWQSQGLCNSNMTADGSFAFRYPSRILAGVAITPTEKSRFELMGGWVGWKAFNNFEISTSNIESTNTTPLSDVARTGLELNRTWARDNVNSFFVGVDGKADVHRYLMVGARALFDKAAVPTAVLSPNNFDTDTVQLAGLIGIKPVPQITIGLSYNHHLMFSRTNDQSAYAVTLDRDARKDDAYFWPSANGTFSGSISRFGLSVRGQFGGDKPKVEAEPDVDPRLAPEPASAPSDATLAPAPPDSSPPDSSPPDSSPPEAGADPAVEPPGAETPPPVDPPAGSPQGEQP